MRAEMQKKLNPRFANISNMFKKSHQMSVDNHETIGSFRGVTDILSVIGNFFMDIIKEAVEDGIKKLWEHYKFYLICGLVLLACTGLLILIGYFLMHKFGWALISMILCTIFCCCNCILCRLCVQKGLRSSRCQRSQNMELREL
jgi:hypothetical protein